MGKSLDNLAYVFFVAFLSVVCLWAYDAEAYGCVDYYSGNPAWNADKFCTGFAPVAAWNGIPNQGQGSGRGIDYSDGTYTFYPGDPMNLGYNIDFMFNQYNGEAGTKERHVTAYVVFQGETKYFTLPGVSGHPEVRNYIYADYSGQINTNSYAATYPFIVPTKLGTYIAEMHVIVDGRDITGLIGNGGNKRGIAKIKVINPPTCTETCPTTCGYGGGTICSGAKTCVATASCSGCAEMCPTYCGYTGGYICSGSKYCNSTGPCSCFQSRKYDCRYDPSNFSDPNICEGKNEALPVTAKCVWRLSGCGLPDGSDNNAAMTECISRGVKCFPKIINCKNADPGIISGGYREVAL